MKLSLQGSVAALCLLLYALCLPVAAQTLNDDRAYEYIDIAPFNLADFSNDIAPVAQLFLYAYGSGAWQQVPFQIDERGMEKSGNDTIAVNSLFPNTKDGLLDDSDQIMFMARDLGERAPANNWLNNSSARGFVRYEIRYTDPLTQRTGYVYLYRSNSLTIDPQLPTYVKYAVGPAANPAADTVKGASYVQGHTSNGVPDYLTIPTAFGGTNTDFLDRLKLRIRAVVPIFGTQTVTEQGNLKVIANGVRTVQGRIRVVRQAQEQISILNGALPIDTLAISLFFYPYSAELTGEINLTSALSARLLRASFDFNAAVNNQTWHNQNAGPRTITGNSGNLNATEAQVTLLPKRNWFSMSSAHGSLVGIFSMDAIANTTQQFYFRDGTGTSDGTSDTGDNVSYGDTGFMITSNSAIIATFQLGMSAYYLKPNLSRAEAQALNANAENPLRANFTSQAFDAVAPATVKDLRVTGSGANDVTLRWTAPSDAGSFVKSYELAYSTTAIGADTSAWFNSIAQKAANLPTPGVPGAADSVTIAGLTAGARYYFLLRAVDDYGNASAFSNLAIINSVAVKESPASMPRRFMLAQNIPNPFYQSREHTTICYELANAQPVHVELRVFNLLGREVQRVLTARQAAGVYEARWNGRFANGTLVPAGIYFYELRAGDLRQVKKMIVVR